MSTPTTDQSRALVNALIVAHALDDVDGTALLLNTLTLEEATAALDVAAGIARRALERQPGGMRRWVRANRYLDTRQAP